jgi:hypothetical protein
MQHRSPRVRSERQWLRQCAKCIGCLWQGCRWSGRKSTCLTRQKIDYEGRISDAAVFGVVLTAYAILSPLELDDSGVGWPRTVVGAAAQIASEEESVWSIQTAAI